MQVTTIFSKQSRTVNPKLYNPAMEYCSASFEQQAFATLDADDDVHLCQNRLDMQVKTALLESVQEYVENVRSKKGKRLVELATRLAETILNDNDNDSLGSELVEQAENLLSFIREG